jgi:tRNA G18 (ribose-2'-O)-methylase SpoU
MPIEVTTADVDQARSGMPPGPVGAALADYVALTDVALRRRAEPERGVYIAESEKVIRRALAAGHRPRSLLMARRWLVDLADVVAQAEVDGVPVLVGDHAVLEALTGFHLHRGALAAMGRPVLPALADLVGAARRLLVLEDVVDHTNVGAAFRSAAALGVDGILVTPRCADPLYRRSIRVSMGTVFQVPWTRIEPWPGGVEHLHAHGFTVAALALTPDAVPLDDLAAHPPERLALVLGTEGDGLGPRTLAAADLAVRIPMAGGVDSLNVAAAAAVAMWALRPTHTRPDSDAAGFRSRSAAEPGSI